MEEGSVARSARLDARIEAIRRFNRLYTQRIGVLHQDYLHSPLSLSQVRVLYEAHRDPPPSAADLGRGLDLDAAYLSRMLKGFERGGLIRRAASQGDGRKSLVALTAIVRTGAASGSCFSIVGCVILRGSSGRMRFTLSRTSCAATSVSFSRVNAMMT